MVNLLIVHSIIGRDWRKACRVHLRMASKLGLAAAEVEEEDSKAKYEC